MPWQGWLHYVLHFLPNTLLVYKFLSVTSWSIISVLIYQILGYVTPLVKKERFQIALLGALFPSYNLWFSIIQMPQPLYVCMFLAGCCLYWEGSLGSNRLQRILGIFLIIPTFALQSLYVFLYGLLFIWFWHTRDINKNFILSGLEFIKKHWFISLFPVVLFILLKSLFLVDPMFGLYNSMNWSKVLIKLAMSFILPVYNVSNELWIVFSKDSVLLVVLLTISVLFSLLYSKFFKLKIDYTPKHTVWKQLLWAGMFLSVMAIFPYALVSKPYLGTNYTGRFSMLLAWPFALFVYSVIKLYIPERWNLGRTIYLSIISFFIFMILKDQVLWQSRYIKYLSVIEQLKDKEETIEKLVFFEDQSSIGKPAQLIYFELNWIMNQAWRNDNHFGFSTYVNNQSGSSIWNELKQMHYFHNLDDSFFQNLTLFSESAVPYGSKSASLIRIDNGDSMSNLEVWFNWIFSSEQKKRSLLNTLTSIEIEKMNFAFNE